MRRIGLQNVRLIETPGNPVVYGDWLGAPGAPTILFYGHYDVQPVDPLDLWQSPPFEPTIRDGEIYARGAADDKGQVFMHLKAIEAHLKQNGRLPVNIKFMIEGEEEVGSAHLDDFIRAHKAELAGRRRRHLRLGDVRPRRAVDLLRPARPRATSRSICAAAAPTCIRASFGGAVANPAFVLAQMIAQMKDRGGRIKVPGFYDDVQAAAGGGAAGVGGAAVQREEVQEGLRHPEAVRRDRLHDARAHVGAADARGERAAVGLHRRGREDRAAGRGDGEDQHAPRARSGSGQDCRRCSRTYVEKARAEDGGGRR